MVPIVRGITYSTIWHARTSIVRLSTGIAPKLSRLLLLTGTLNLLTAETVSNQSSAQRWFLTCSSQAKGYCCLAHHLHQTCNWPGTDTLTPHSMILPCPRPTWWG
jgi:hypothetical protein